MRFYRTKSIQKWFYDINWYRCGNCLVLLVIIQIGFLWIFYTKMVSISTIEFRGKKSTKNPIKMENIDVVYTWVNGSDPDFIVSIQQYDPSYDRARFDDKNELKYSIRSLFKYAPWIGHIYIVTNGQIPYWLDLEQAQVTLIQHSDLTDRADWLPTFSSASIETFLHRIPNLSQRFLYLNDDIFLGANLYPEDLYTSSEGVKIYTAWSVPDCVPDCPWIYIGDGTCDPECNREECKFDEGDCSDVKSTTIESNIQSNDEFIDKLQQKSDDLPKFLKHLNNSQKIDENLSETVRRFNDQQQRQAVRNRRRRKVKRQKRYRSSHSANLPNSANIDDILAATTDTIDDQSKDIFARSLIYTNRIFNQRYGFKARKVIAHVGLLLDRSIIEEMLDTYPNEFSLTRQHRLRHPQDMQFSFAYYHHLQQQQIHRHLDEIFDEFDTDRSGSWSDREIRTLLTRIYPLPLRWDAMRYFEDILINCSSNDRSVYRPNIIYPTLIYERYEDSNIATTITKDMIVNCQEISTILRRNFGQKSRYCFTINQKTWLESNFKMLTSSVPQVVDALDELRKNPKKFNCINDNIENSFHRKQTDDYRLIAGLLEDFYMSMFPEPSQIELPSDYRNRFRTINEYRQWKRTKLNVSILIYGLCGLCIVFSIRFLCYRTSKRKFLRKISIINC